MGGGDEVCWMRMEYLLTAAAASQSQLLLSLPRGAPALGENRAG
jgi:hypothetical protein